MGIKNLNKYLYDNCSKNSIKKCTIKDFRNKTFVVDISIYIYKFISDNAFLENLFLMISIFRQYNINALFVYDGKPPQEKNRILMERKNKKNTAEEIYNNLKNRLEQTNDKEDINEIQEQMENLKNQFIRITSYQLDQTKQLINHYGYNWIVAEGEADILCVDMVISGKAYCCVSDDMDMFVYGCPRVIRNINILKQTCVLYELDIILKELDMNLEIFKQICILSGTDYNYDNKDIIELDKAIEYYNNYKKSCINQEFYKWCITMNYIKDYENIEKIYNMFDILKFNRDTNIIIKEIGNIKYKDIENLLSTEGFIFCCK
jgi:flap endonuclease-1